MEFDQKNYSVGASPTEFTSQRRPCALPRAGSPGVASGVPPHPNTPVPPDAPPHACSACVVSACLPIRRATTAPLTTAPCVSVGANTTAAPLTTAPVSPAALPTRLRRSAYAKHRPKQKQCRFRCAAPFFSPAPAPPPTQPCSPRRADSFASCCLPEHHQAPGRGCQNSGLGPCADAL